MLLLSLSVYLSAQIPEKLDYRGDMLPVRDQGEKGNCLAYAAATIKEWQEYKKTGVKKYFSPDFIYKNRRDSMEIDMEDVARVLKIKCIPVKSVDELKRALSNDGPCIINMQIYDKTSRMWYPNDSKKVMSYHSMVIVGYANEGFILRNSWGASWGDNGYCIFPYQDWKWKWQILKCIEY